MNDITTEYISQQRKLKRKHLFPFKEGTEQSLHEAFSQIFNLYKGCVCNYLTRKEATKQAQQSSLRSKLVFYLAGSYCWKHNQVVNNTVFSDNVSSAFFLFRVQASLKETQEIAQTS